MSGPAAARLTVAAAWPVHLALVVFVASGAIGVWAAPEPGSAWQAVAWLGGGAALYAAMYTTARARWAETASRAVTVAAGATLAAVFLAQYRDFVRTPKSAVPDAIGRWLSAPFSQLDLWTALPNSIGVALDGPLLAALGATLGAVSGRGRLLAGGAATVLGVALVVSASRGSWLAVVVAVLALGVTLLVPPALARRGQVALGISAVAMAAAAIAGVVHGGTPWWIAAGTRVGRPDRLEVFGHAVTLLRDVPYTGIGAGEQFAAAVSKYVLLIQVPYLTYSHNLTLDVWLEQGLPGLAAWGALAAATAVGAAAGERAALGWGFRGVWAGLLATHVHGLSDARQSVDGWTWLPFFALTGLLVQALARHDVRLTRAAALAPAAVGLVFVAAVLLGRAAPVAAWNANLGAVAQARADLDPAASPATRVARRTVATAELRRALTRTPTDAPALRRLGLLELDNDRHQEALVLLGAAWESEPTPPARKALGLAAMWTGSAHQAATLLSSVPEITAELNAWAHWRTTRGELPLAIAAYETSLAIQFDQPDVAKTLVELRAAVGPAPR